MFRRLPLLLALLASSCGTSPRDEGDEAFSKEQWERAIEIYEGALRHESDPQEVAYLKARAAEARAKLAGRESQEARTHLDLAQFDKAIAHARRALAAVNTAETAGLLRKVKQDYARHLFQKTKQQLNQGFVDDALQSVEEAGRLDPLPDYLSLTQDLRGRQLEIHGADFHKHFARGNELFDKRQWMQAAMAFADAHTVKRVQQAKSREEFCMIMLRVQQNPAAARAELERAQALGYHREHVVELLDRTGR